MSGGGGDLDDSDVVSPSRFPALARVVELLGQGELVRAFEELGVLLDSADEDLRPRAVLLLARINEARGNTEQMLHAYQVAAASGHLEVAPFASLQLAGEFLERGQFGLARRALRQAARASDPEVRQAAQSALRAMPQGRWRLPWRR